jgi:hypothetical protein
VKPFKPLSFDFHRRILRIGQIPFLLDPTQLVFDLIKAGILALQFGAQAGRKRVAFANSQHPEINPCTPQPWPAAARSSDMLCHGVSTRLWRWRPWPR